MANIGVMAALLGRRDVVCQDRLNHASLLDGGLLCGARLLRYAHGDVQALQQRLAALAGGEILVATDGVFSMDGDLAPLPGLVALARQHRAWLMVDDAHGLGVLGRGGGGSLEAFGVGARDVPILVGTLGKAFGTAGAFVAGNDDLIETLIHRARSYIYTTAMPAALAAATRTSLRLVRSEGWRRDRLRTLVTRFRAGAAQLGLPLMESETQIQPLQIGDSATALTLGKALRDRGILITAIRPPTVPAGTARLRVTFAATHTDTHVDRLLEALDQVRIPAIQS
jgi:8-amino-7-oxononanoate synthase